MDKDKKEKPRWTTRYGPKGPEREHPQLTPEMAEEKEYKLAPRYLRYLSHEKDEREAPQLSPEMWHELMRRKEQRIKDRQQRKDARKD
jgi:hypothetical protein